MFSDSTLTRRAFVGGGLALAGGLAVARSSRSPHGPRRARPRWWRSPSRRTCTPHPIHSASPWCSQQGTSDGIRYVSGPPVSVRFKGPGGSFGPYAPMTLDRAGLPKGRGVYRTDATFATPGTWDGETKFLGKTTKFAMTVRCDRVRAGTEAGGAPRRVADPDRHARREPDLHARPDVPVAHGVAVGRDRHRASRSRCCSRRPRCATSPVLRPGARRDAEGHEAVRGPHHLRARRHLQEPDGNHASRRRSPRGTYRASRGSSRSTARATWSARIDTAFGRDEMQEMLDDLLVSDAS